MPQRRRIVDDELYCHFVTFSCALRRRLLNPDATKRIVLGVLNDQLTRESAKCVGFVVMPDHVHALIWLPETGRLSNFMLGWKRVSSYRIGEWYRRYGSEYAAAMKENGRVWQPRYYAFAIYSDAKLREKLDYMHRNPVAAGLTAEPSDWRWSSARWYERRRSVGVTVEWIG